MIMLFAGVLMGALDISILGPAIPSIEKALHVTSSDSGNPASSLILAEKQVR